MFQYLILDAGISGSSHGSVLVPCGFFQWLTSQAHIAKDKRWTGKSFQSSTADGSVFKVWLPAEKVKVRVDLEHPDRMSIFGLLDIVLIAVDDSAKFATDQTER